MDDGRDEMQFYMQDGVEVCLGIFTEIVLQRVLSVLMWFQDYHVALIGFSTS